ncbi:MAG TPA: hypothetical protein VFO34_14655 [Candidatus Acidoferrales bacterium]|nr:hypothetical protein [Candidatus Acidoferrales bacterium]
MNKMNRLFAIALATGTLLAGVCVAQSKAPGKASDEFYLISSVDRPHNMLVLMHPWQVTQTVSVTDKTQYLDDQGKPIKLTDLRAGDTIFATTHADKSNVVVDKIRKGVMTVSELRKRYLPYLPATAGNAKMPGSGS